MNLIKTISRLNFTSIWKLVGLSIANLDKVWPTYRATKECMAVSTYYFGRKHYQNGAANAFRHALWNVLIAKKTFGPEHTLEKTVAWAKKITDWHENAFFSKSLAMNMDFHNNAVGRLLFLKNWQWTQEQFIQHLLLLTEDAVKINEISELNPLKNQLVYITDGY